VEESISIAQIERLVIKAVKSRLQEAIEEYVAQNELRLKELSLIERIVRVEEELRSMREMSESKFELLQREITARFDATEKRFDANEKRFESLQREMNARFDATEKRFDATEKRFDANEKRFESLQREMNARFEASEKRFESLQREMNARFDALLREMNARFDANEKRFEAMDKRFSTIQWMIGILVGIPAIVMTIIQLVKII
jgi:chaperonin cofactor prefoldin